jgi:hypothetical protein
MSKAKTPIVAVTGAGVKRHYTVMTLTRWPRGSAENWKTDGGPDRIRRYRD